MILEQWALASELNLFTKASSLMSGFASTEGGLQTIWMALNYRYRSWSLFKWLSRCSIVNWLR